MKSIYGILLLGFVLAAAANSVEGKLLFEPEYTIQQLNILVSGGTIVDRDVNAAADKEEAEYGRPQPGWYPPPGRPWGPGGRPSHSHGW